MDKIVEEKAREIIGNDCKKENCLECGGRLSVEKGCAEFIHIMKMAEWMKQQMIEKAVKWLEDNINNYIFNDTYQLPSGKKSRDWFKIKSECFSDFRNAMED